jgi:hypothetical protein
MIKMEELDKINDSLYAVGKDLPYKVPREYFDNLPMRIQSRCVEQNFKARNSAPVGIAQILKAQLSLAIGFVMMALIAFTGYFYIRPTGNNGDTAKEDYIEIVQKNIYEYDQGAIKNRSKMIDGSDSLKNNYRDEMIKYLIEENNDFVTLMEKY